MCNTSNWWSLTGRTDVKTNTGFFRANICVFSVAKVIKENVNKYNKITQIAFQHQLYTVILCGGVESSICRFTQALWSFIRKPCSLFLHGWYWALEEAAAYDFVDTATNKCDTFETIKSKNHITHSVSVSVSIFVLPQNRHQTFA